MQDQDTWMDPPDAAAYLGMTERWIRRQIESRTIPFNKLGGRIRFRKSDLDEIIERGDIPAERELVPRGGRPRRRHRTAERDVA